MIWVKITASEQELEQFCYLPLESGKIYKAEYTNEGARKFYDVFIDDEYFIKGVWSGRLKELSLDEIREYKLNVLLDETKMY